MNWLVPAVAVLWLSFRAAASSEYLIDTWDTSSGLPQSTVRAIAQTPDGYLWIGTENGLARFDGVRFVSFLRENVPHLANPNIESLCLDRNGSLWVGAAGYVGQWNGRSLARMEWPLASNDHFEGLLISHTNEIVFHTAQGCLVRGRPTGNGNWQWTSSRPAGICYFAVDAREGIWRLSSNGRLWRMADLQPQLVQAPIEAGRLHYLANDAAGRVWLGAEHQLLVEESGQFQAVPPPPRQQDISVSTLIPTKDGGLWVVANEHLWKIKDRHWVLDAGPWPARWPSLRLLAEDRESNVWFSQFGTGLLRLGSDGRLLTLTGRDGLPGDRARCLTQDREGNLWVGMDRGGLVRLREKWFQVLGTPEGLSDSVALGVCEDREGVIWTGTYGGGLNECSKGRFTMHDFGVDGTKGYVFTVFPDDQDRLWIGTRDNGVFVRDGLEFKRPFGSNAISEATRAIYEDRDHAIWFGTSAGAYRWQSNRLEHLAEATDLARADVRALAEDRDGSLWIGTHGDGLHRLRNGIHVAFHAKDGLPNEFVRSLLADSDGTLWIGFYGGGIYRWRGDRLAQAAPASDLPDDVICHIEDDGAGRLWISTHHGLFRVAKSDLHAFADGRRKHITCITYGKFDGLPTVEFSGGIQPSGWRGRDGRLWFTTGKGLVSLQPASITINPLPPPVVVESLLVDGEIFAASTEGGAAAQNFSGPLNVPAGRTRFEFRFTGLSFTAPDKVRFQYQLKGLEDDWMDAGMNRSVAYNYLAPGDYEFRVKAANNDGVWNETGASVSFAVLPHVWQRGWFRALLLAVIVGLVWLAYYVRIRRLHELERLRLRIARDLHDDVGANLASMALIAEAMEKQPSFGSPAELRRLALQTVDALRDIVWFIDPARDSLGDLVTRLRDTAAALLTSTRFDFHAAVPNPALPLPPGFRRNVLPIFKEALHNAALHGRAGHVDIALDCANGLLRLTVKDDGKGFDEHRVTPGNGLRNLRRRAADMHGAVEISSEPGKGTTVKLEARFPQMRGFSFGPQRVYSKSLAGPDKNSTGQNNGAKP